MSAKKDLTGKKIGRLTVIEETQFRYGTSVIWRCRCDCGEVVMRNQHQLTHAKTPSCGCAIYKHKLRKMPDGTIRKYCNRCKSILPICEFYKVTSRASGYHHECKACSRERRSTLRYRTNKAGYDKVRCERIKKMEKPAIKEKTCSKAKCGRVLPISMFNKDCSRLDGYHPYCKECVAKHKNKERVFRYNKKYREEMPDAYIRSVLAAHSHLTAGDIPDELIDVGRLYVMALRELNERSQYEKRAKY